MVLEEVGFTRTKSLSSQSKGPIMFAELAVTAPKSASQNNNPVCLRFVDTCQHEFNSLHTRLSSGTPLTVTDSAANTPPGSNVLVIDELWDTVSSHFTTHQWDMLQELIRKECNILWVTSGALLQTSHPHRATSHGLLRVIRNEEPHLRVVTLDVEESRDGNYAAAVRAIEVCLERLVASTEEFRNECEYVERGGLVYTSRVVQDEQLNEVKLEHVSGRAPRRVDFLAGDKARDQGQGPTPSFQLRAEQRGVIDSLYYSEESATGLPPPADGFVEIDVCAAGVNFKDVAVVMGWAAGDQNKLGLEGAGIVTRVPPSSNPPFKLGQRVVFLQEGSFANKVHVPVQAVHAIPDAMPFDVAASLPVAYLTALYALFDLGNLQRGQRVLVHSAAGAVGNAAMQICQHMGAEVYATVGNDEKRVFLRDEFGIPTERVFSSRNAEFGQGVMKATRGQGVDLVLNSLSGDLLEASWNVVAVGGTLVEIGKRDINDRNRLSMEPFGRGASFRALDLSLFTRWGKVVARYVSFNHRRHPWGVSHSTAVLTT